MSLQRGGASVEGRAHGGVRGRQTGGADTALPAEGVGDDGGSRELAEEGGGPARTGTGPGPILFFTPPQCTKHF